MEPHEHDDAFMAFHIVPGAVVLATPAATPAAEPGALRPAPVVTSSQPANTSAEADPAAPVFSVSWDATMATRYVFQGFDYSNSNPVVQPELILNVKDFSGTVWFNQDLETGLADEFDFNFKYVRTVCDFSVAAGYTRSVYPHREEGCFVTLENGGFRDANAVASSWVFALNVAQSF